MDHNIQPKLSFKIEQVALCPADPDKAIALLTKMGLGEWARDHVKASGRVFGQGGTNEADLAFNYQGTRGFEGTLADGMHGDLRNIKPLELEVLHYTDGDNWMKGDCGEEARGFHRPCSVSHLGMHCDAKELARWRGFFAAEGIREAQSVLTFSHTNPVIAGKRTYNYVIYDTREILGVDVKFIVRMEK